jgi:hypothetical protein
VIPLAKATLGGREPFVPCPTERHAREPRPEAIVALDRARPPGQDQERILEGVLDFVRLTEDCAADREDHRTVMLDQDPERLRVIRGDETFQKLPLRHLSASSVHSDADTIELFDESGSA